MRRKKQKIGMVFSFKLKKRSIRKQKKTMLEKRVKRNKGKEFRMEDKKRPTIKSRFSFLGFQTQIRNPLIYFRYSFHFVSYSPLPSYSILFINELTPFYIAQKIQKKKKTIKIILNKNEINV